MAAQFEVMHNISSQRVSNQWLESNGDNSGGLLISGQYSWFASGANIILYSKQLGSIVSSRSFDSNQKDKTLKITSVKELNSDNEPNNFLLVGCAFKSSGILFVCQLPTLTTIRCIELPLPISYIDKIKKNPFTVSQFCNEFKIMSTVLLVGMVTGAVYAIDLRQNDIEKELRQNGIIIDESRPNKLLMIKKNEDSQEIKKVCNKINCHMALFINDKFLTYCKNQYTNKLKLNVTCLMFIEEINTIAMGYSTGHFQLWDCKIKRIICSLEEANCFMPITHISFLEPSDDPNNLCYIWVIQSDNSKLPNATMIGLNYKHRVTMPNGLSSYRTYAGNGIKLQVNLKKESGVGRCISASSVCNMNFLRDENDIDEDSEIRLFSMLIEICQSPNDDPECYVFVFDINQWYKAQMPSIISHLKVSNMYASFVKLPRNAKYLDLKISDRTLRPFGNNFRNNIEELYYPSSMYFECDCLLSDEIIQFKHAGIQQEILDQLLKKNWKLLTNPTLVFNQCLQTNLKPFFWDKTDDYVKYSVPDQRSFVISILVENKMMSVISECAEEWKNGTYISSEATILHLVQCLWKHVMAVKQYADKLCVSLFDYSGTQMDKKNQQILSYCLSQMQCVKNFLDYLCSTYGAHIINVDYSNRVFTLNLVTEYFKAVICFINYGLLPESNEPGSNKRIIQCDFTSLIQYADNRRSEFGNLQFYLIDAIIHNDPKGNKLIEQWQHEGCEITKGLYPPSNVQCLLRIYLNAALTDTVKNFITIYFLIDVCSSLNLDINVANRMCNFAIEFDVENKILNTLCRASWLFDHDMFEDAINVLSNDNNWSKIESQTWNWYHWIVLKLLVYKKEYFWAQLYMKLTNVELLNIEDRKFYMNIQIMNNKCFEILSYVRARPSNEKKILFEYYFDRCKETNRLKCLIEYPFESDEEELFLNYLKSFNDMDSVTYELLFLLQRGRYLEAIEQKKLFRSLNKEKCNDLHTITNLMVSGFDKCIPDSMRKNLICPPVKNLYKKSDVTVKYMNSDSSFFSMVKEKKDTVKPYDPSLELSNNNLLIPLTSYKMKRSPIHDIVADLKRRKLSGVTCLLKVNDAIDKPIFGKQELEILNTPLVAKNITQTSVQNYSSILKVGSAKKNNRILSMKSDTPESKVLLRFSLPGDNDTESIEQKHHGKTMEISNVDSQSVYKNENKNDSVNISTAQLLDLNELLKDNSKKESLDNVLTTDKNEIDKYEPMEISAEFVLDDISHQNSNNQIEPKSSNYDVVDLLSSSDEEIKENKIKNNTKLISPKPTCSTFNKNEYDSKCLLSNDKEIKKQHVQRNITDTSHQHSKNTGIDTNCTEPVKLNSIKSSSSDIEGDGSSEYSMGQLLNDEQSIYSDEEQSINSNEEQSINSNEEQSINSDEEQSINSNEQPVYDVQSIYSDEEQQNIYADLHPANNVQSISSDEQSANEEQDIDDGMLPLNNIYGMYSDEQLLFEEQNLYADLQTLNDTYRLYSDELPVDEAQNIFADVHSVNYIDSIYSDEQPADEQNIYADVQPVNDIQIISSDKQSVDKEQNIYPDVQPVNDIKGISSDKQLVDKEQNIYSDVQPVNDVKGISSDKQPVDKEQNIYSDVQPVNDVKDTSSDKQSVDKEQNIYPDVQPVNDVKGIYSDEQLVNEKHNIYADIQTIHDTQSIYSDEHQNIFADVHSVNYVDSIYSNEQLVDEDQNIYADVQPEIDIQSISSDEQPVDKEQNIYPDVQPENDIQSISSDEQPVDEEQNIFADVQPVNDVQSIYSDEQLVDEEQNIYPDMQPVIDIQIISSDEQSQNEDQNKSPCVQSVYDKNIPSVMQLKSYGHDISSVKRTVNDNQRISSDVQLINDDQDSDVQLIDDDRDTDVQLIDDDQDSDVQLIHDSQSDESDLETTRFGRFKFQNRQVAEEEVVDEEEIEEEGVEEEEIEEEEFEEEEFEEEEEIYDVNDDRGSINYHDNSASNRLMILPPRKHIVINLDSSSSNASTDEDKKVILNKYNVHDNINDSNNPIVQVKSPQYVDLCENSSTNENEDDSELNHSISSNLGPLKNLISSEIIQIEENHYSHRDSSISDIEIQNKQNVASNPSDQDNLKETIECVHANNCDEICNTQGEEVNNVEIIHIDDNEVNNVEIIQIEDNDDIQDNEVNNVEIIHTDENDIEMSKNESCPVSNDEFIHQKMSETEVSQPVNVDNHVDRSSPFLFGKAFFGKQETPEYKPLLFGQLYTTEKKHTDIDSHNNEPGTQNVNLVNSHGEQIIHTKSLDERETVDEIQDILELKSLPESNPEENTDALLISNTNKLKFEKQESNETVGNNIQSTVILDNSQSLKLESNPEKSTNIPIIISHTNNFKFEKPESNETVSDNIQSTVILDNCQSSKLESNPEESTNVPIIISQTNNFKFEKPESNETVSDNIQSTVILDNCQSSKLESNPEESTNVPIIISQTNNFKFEIQESNETVSDNIQSTVILDTSQLSKNINSKEVSEVEIKTEPPLLQDVTEIKNLQMDGNSSLQKIMDDNVQSMTEKLSDDQTNRVIITRSRAKSVSSQQEGNSFNLFRLYDDNNSRQVRVSLNKYRSKSQENDSLIKRKREKSKSPTNLETNKKTMFGLDKIPEEGSSSNADKVMETKHTKNSKFNFSKNTSKVKKCDKLINLQPDTIVKTPRKARSLHSEPAATMSVLKKRSKRSSSVGLLLSDDESDIGNDSYMEVLKKVLGPNTKKSSRAGSVTKRKKPKMITQNTSNDGSEYDSNGSIITLNESITSNISPIMGDNPKHILITPAKHKTKLPMKLLDSNEESDGTFSDESTNSKRLTRSTIHNSSSLNIDYKHKPSGSKSLTTSKLNIKKETMNPPDRRVTRSQTLNLDNSLQSTSWIGRDQAEKVPVPKSGKKKPVKQKNSMN